MYQHERHRLIVERARSRPRVEVSALADELNVTTETIRRDLTVLERHGLLHRVHGGAIAVDKLGFEPTTQVRAHRNVTEKERIAKAAAAMIPQAGTILLDAGTTTLGIAHRLPSGRELTVVTNSFAIAAVLADRADLTLYLLGGRVRGTTQALVGDWATQALAGIHVDVAFLGTNGMCDTAGLTTPDQAEAATKRAMVGACQRAVVVADHSKVGVTHFARFAHLADIDTIITDTGIDPVAADELAAAGPEIIRA